jgi:hypothetical protein
VIVVTGPQRLVLLAVVVLGCGPGAMPVDEYFAELEEAATRFAVAGRDLGDRYDAEMAAGIARLQSEFAAADPEQLEQLDGRALELGIETTVAALTARGDGFARYLQELEVLRPPSVAAGAHAAAVDALEQLDASLQPTTAAVRALGSIDELAATLAGSPFTAAHERLGEACRSLQRVALAEGEVVDLRCPGEDT